MRAWSTLARRDDGWANVDHWHDVRAFLLQQAREDLDGGADIRPCLVAFCGEQLLFVAFLRSFDEGAYADPIIELLALAAPLGADRLALSLPGRAWSLHDPVPPVVEGLGDLRQRVLCTITVDATAGDAGVSIVVRPFTRADADVVWGHPACSDDGEGWVVSALSLATQSRAALAASKADISCQARRCVALGHILALHDGVAKELGLDDRPPAR